MEANERINTYGFPRDENAVGRKACTSRCPTSKAVHGAPWNSSMNLDTTDKTLDKWKYPDYKVDIYGTADVE